MRKLMALLLAAWMCLLPIMGLADSLEKRAIPLYSADVAFSVPADFACMTRDDSATVFSRYGLSQREALAYMEAYQVYALILDLTTGDEYHIEVYPWNDGESFDQLPAEEAETQREMLQADLTAGGYQVSDVNWYQSPQHAYLMAEGCYFYEDGSEQWELLCETIQCGYIVQVRCILQQGEVTDIQRTAVQTIAASMSVTSTGVYMLTDAASVQSQVQEDGTMTFSMPGLTVTAKPLTKLYYATRDSGKVMFERMGYMYKKTLANMKADGTYAIVRDAQRLMEIDLYLYGDAREQEYTEMTDAEIWELERAYGLERGWNVEACEVFSSGPWKFSRLTVSYTEADDIEIRNIACATCINGYRIEVWGYTGEAELEQMELAMDTFMQGFTVEDTEE